jgi:hypothetical protein
MTPHTHKEIMNKIFILLPIVVLSACADRGMYNREYGSMMQPNHLVDPRTLKPDSIKSLTKEEIDSALDYGYSFKKIKRIAFLPVGSYGQDLIGIQADLIKLANDSVPGIEVKKLPSLLLPNSPDIDNLQKICVKMQVDTLLIFNIYSNNRYKPRIFSSDKFRTAMSVDFYILDVRTGLIPYADSLDRVQEFADGVIDNEKMEEMRRRETFDLIRSMIAALTRKINQ